VHWEDELLKTTPGQAALHGAHNALVTLMAGFTTCRDMGPTWPFTDIDLRKAIDEGVVPGRAAGVGQLHLADRRRRRRAAVLDLRRRADREKPARTAPTRVRKAVRTNLKQGADFIKILGTGAVLSKGAPPGGQQYSEEEMHVAVEEAARWGKHVAAHLHGTAGIKAGSAPASHGRSRQHDGRRGRRSCCEPTTPTSCRRSTQRIDREPERPGVRESALATNHEREGRLVSAGPEGGLPIGFATDAAVVRTARTRESSAIAFRLGQSPIAAICPATKTAAEIIGWSDRVGTIEAGKFAT
jgi:imidazolonepropionase-like amidohydrolase